MISRHFNELGLKRLLLVPNKLFDQNMFVLSLSKHSPACPQLKRKVCPGSRGKAPKQVGQSSGGSFKLPDFKRSDRAGPVKFEFIPDEWFKFFYVKTGVSGPYIFGLVTINYLLSKEIYVLEHEYYSGLSIALLVYLATVKLGPAAGAALDKEADAVVAGWQKTLDDDKAVYLNQIKASKDAQWRADGQKLLMDAKKENIAMQYEAIFRERLMKVYNSTEGRMIYHAKKYRSEARIHQKWMIQWILNNVRKSITPDFKRAALEASIRDLAAATPKEITEEGEIAEEEEATEDYEEASQKMSSLTPKPWEISLKDLDFNYWCKFQYNGYRCQENVERSRFYYDIKMDGCKTFTYNGCPTKFNNFLSLSECNEQCADAGHMPLIGNTSDKISCRLQPDFGTCDGYFPMWYYDINERVCKGFSWSGCGGNFNRFENEQLCTITCPALVQY